jgi:hypothetical protein
MGPMHVLVIVFITVMAAGFYLFWFKLVPWAWKRLVRGTK